MHDESGRTSGLRRRIAIVLIAVAVVLDLGAAAGMTLEAATRPPPTAHPSPLRLAATSVARGAAGGLQNPQPAPTAKRSASVPTRILIPTIGVDAPLQRLARDRAGVLQPPTLWASAGWYAGGVVPGDQGAAVIAGHLDTTKRAAVFVNLRELRPGDGVRVRMSDGRTLRFTVTASRVVAKALFPTSEVYGPTPDPQLRLITCNEPFDEVHGIYADNLVVFATLDR